MVRTPHAVKRLTSIVAMLVAAEAAAVNPSELPSNGRVTSGSAAIVQNGSAMTVNQSSHRLITIWDTFNIGSAARVQFVQPASSSVALNRVTSSQPSHVFGQLNANGQVFLINPSGVIFAPGSSVNVGALVASTLNIKDEDFLAGRYVFSEGARAGSVLNQGEIRAQNGGYVALLGSQVRNDGSIESPNGSVALGAGERITLASHDGLLNLEVDAAALGAAVANKGLLRADGGQVVMKVGATDAALSTVLNQSGTIEARSLVARNGSIYLDGGASGVVEVTGTLDASAKADGHTGGTVTVLGDQAGLFAGARIDVSGAAGGGSALVGGNWQGSGSEPHARATYVDPGARIVADAVARGDGGKVVVWSDDATRFYGAISARGGTHGGNGGQVETSGKAYLDAAGSVDASASAGRAGVWLLDPRNVTITTTQAGGSFSGANPDVFTPTANSATVNAANINTSLNGGTSVTITTGSTGTQSGDITVSSVISKSAGTDATLTLLANRDINVNANITSTSNKLHVVLNSTATGGPGSVSIGSGAQITTNGGDITIGGGANPAVGNAVGGGVTTNGFRMQGGGGLLSAGAGNILINAQGSGNSSGISLLFLGGNTITTTTGSITLNGTGAGIGNGINISSGTNTISSSSGTITLNGTAPGSGSGIAITSTGTNAVTTGTGTIALNGTSASGSGVELSSTTGSALIEATSGGSVQVTAQASGASQAFSMRNGGNNTIRNTSGAISITATNNGTGSAFGMGSGGGVNTIQTTIGGNLTITATANGASGFGVSIGSGGTNTLSSAGGALSINANSAGSDSAFSLGSGTNVVQATGAGSVTLSGTATGSGNGVAIGSGGTNTVQVASGALAINGTAGSGNGIRVSGTGTSSVLSTTGPITLTGVSASDNAIAVDPSAGLARVAASGAGDITLAGDRMDLAPSATGVVQLASNGGVLSIRQTTPGTTIGIGTDARGTLNWNATEIGQVQPGFALVRIGDSQSGTIEVRPPNFPAPVVLGQDGQQLEVEAAVVAARASAVLDVLREDGRLTLEIGELEIDNRERGKATP